MIKQNSSNALNKAFLLNACRINGALELIAGRWKALILIHISEGVNRFSLLKNVLPSISDQALGKQLKTLEKDGLLSREIVAEVPVRVNYHLTEKSTALLPILSDLSNWYDL